MDVNEFHNIYAHSHEGLLRTTAKRLGTELIGDMHACTRCSMSKAIRKGIAHETNVDRIKSWAKFLLTWREEGRCVRRG